jgi:hypothetical protein
MTTLLAGVVLKLVPVRVTVVPTAPLEGEKDEIAGAWAYKPNAHARKVMVRRRSFMFMVDL